MVRLTDRPDMTLGVYRGRKTTMQQQQQQYRDQTWFSMHKRLPGPEGDVENRGRRPRFSTSPEGPGKC